MAARIMVECARCGQLFSTSKYKPAQNCSLTCFWGSPEVRLMAKTDKSPGHGPNGDCWIWTGLKSNRGYGKITVDDKTIGTHVLSYTLYRSPVPKGMFVCHSCDNPACLRPDHLWIGDAYANNCDRDAKGRNRYQVGQSHHQSKLTDKDVLKIRQDTRMQKIIAQEYGVAKSQISQIKSGKTWRHLLPPSD